MFDSFIEGLTELKKLGAKDYSFEHDVMYVYGDFNFDLNESSIKLLERLENMGFHWSESDEHFYKYS